MSKIGLKLLMLFLCVGMIACSKKGFKDAAGPDVPAPDEIINTNPEDEGSLNNPGTNNPGTSTPGTNNPGTNNPGTNNPGNNPDVIVCEDGNGTIEIVKPVKVLFVVDKSGSNETGTGTSGVGTDPNKTFRYGVMNDFYQQHRAKTNLSWGFIAFNDRSAKALINSGSDSSPKFSRNTQDMANAFASFDLADSGGTPYKAALNMIEKAIEADIANSSIDAEYLVAFVTDGVPSDYCLNSNAANCPDAIDEGRINQDLTRMLSLAPSRIQFGTVYYGPPDKSAEDRLARMASMGGGQFVNTNIAGSTIALNDVITVPKPNCP